MTADPALIDALCVGAQGLVHGLARRVHRQFQGRLDFDDLLGYGQIGIRQAAIAFDPALGLRFSTFAHPRIRGAIYDGISRMTGISRAQYRKAKFHARAGELVSNQAVADPATALREEADWLRHLVEQLTVAYVAVAAPEAVAEIPDTACPPDVLVAAKDAHSYLRGLVDGLNGAERTLIQAVFFEETTLEEAARRIGISTSWASRLCAQTLDQLRRSLIRAGVDLV